MMRCVELMGRVKVERTKKQKIVQLKLNQKDSRLSSIDTHQPVFTFSVFLILSRLLRCELCNFFFCSRRSLLLLRNSIERFYGANKKIRKKSRFLPRFYYYQIYRFQLCKQDNVKDQGYPARIPKKFNNSCTKHISLSHFPPLHNWERERIKNFPWEHIIFAERVKKHFCVLVSSTETEKWQEKIQL